MASSIVKPLGSLMQQEVESLYKVKDKIERLKKYLEWMESFLRDADSQPHQEEVVCKWVSEVRDLAYDSEDIIERYHHDVSHHRRDGVLNTLKWVSRLLSTCDSYALHNLGSYIDGIMIRISDLSSNLDMCGLNRIMPTSGMGYNTMFMEERRTYSHTEEDVVGIDKDIQQVVEQLVKADVKVVGISGIGGLGKTTLARKVFKHQKIKDHFNDNCAWVYISKEFEKGNIFRQILLELEKGEVAQKRIKDKLNVELPGDLHKVLQEKECLVVVDDIWTKEAWESLKSGFEIACATTSASKILFTTRNQDLLKHFNACGYLHPLNPLSDDESWKLLKMKAFTGHGRTGGESYKLIHEQDKTEEIKSKGNDDQVKHEGDDMEKLGREMLKHCGGLPIAIVALGGILLRKKTIREWKKVKENLSAYLISGVNEGDGDDNLTFKVLELSYYDLPSYLKPCFLYLGIFPEDYSISAHRLYHLWVVERFLAEGTCYDVGAGYLEELVQRSMVQVGERWPSGGIKTCRVHDVMREMCLRKCKEVGFLNFIGCNESDSVVTHPAFSVEMKKFRRCGLDDRNTDFFDKYFEHGAEAAGLRSLLLFQDERRHVQKLWKCCPMLRVLDLQGTKRFVGSIDGVGDLSHLRYLNLRNTDVQVLPSCLYDLKYLETLDLRSSRRGSNIKLKNKFDKMMKLRHLYLPYTLEVEGGEKLKFPNEGLQMESLKNFDLKRCETTQLSGMTKLRVFSISRYSYFEKVEDWKSVWMAPVMKNEGQLINPIRHLYIIGNDILSSAARDIGVLFPETLTRVSLFRCIIGVGEVFALEKLSHLKGLNLYGGTGVGNKLMSFSAGSFPKLSNLQISNQTGLEKWEVGEGALPNLESLFLYTCEELEEWEVRKGALPNLQYLTFHGCMKLKKLNFPQSLTTVRLESCDIKEGGSLLSALENLPHFNTLMIGDGFHVGSGDNNRLSFSPRSFPQLTKLYLTGLAGMEFEDGSFPSLQFLELERCGELNKVANIPNSLTEVFLKECEIEVSLLNELEKLPHLQQLLLFTPIIQGREANKLSFRAASFPQLTRLQINSAGELEELEIGDGALPNLVELKLYKCRKLKRIPSNLPGTIDIDPPLKPAAATRFKQLMSCLR